MEFSQVLAESPEVHRLDVSRMCQWWRSWWVREKDFC